MGGISIWQLLLIVLLIFLIYLVYRHTKRTPTTDKARIGGWLLFLVVKLMVLGPLMGFAELGRDSMLAEAQTPGLADIPEWHSYTDIVMWVFLVTSCLSFYTGLMLVRRREVFVIKRTIILLWIIGPVASIIMGHIIPLLLFGPLEAGATDTEYSKAFLFSCVHAGIWTAYLTKSRRVKATYTKQPESAVPKEDASSYPS